MDCTVVVVDGHTEVWVLGTAEMVAETDEVALLPNIVAVVAHTAVHTAAHTGGAAAGAGAGAGAAVDGAVVDTAESGDVVVVGAGNVVEREADTGAVVVLNRIGVVVVGHVHTSWEVEPDSAHHDHRYRHKSLVVVGHLVAAAVLPADTDLFQDNLSAFVDSDE